MTANRHRVSDIWVGFLGGLYSNDINTNMTSAFFRLLTALCLPSLPALFLFCFSVRRVISRAPLGS